MTFNHTKTPQIPELESETSATGKRFYITPNGDKYPSITTVLGVKEKPWLKDWTQMLGEKKAKREQKRCADRGTAIHELVERYLNNEQNFTRGYDSEFVRGFNQLKLRLKHVDNIRRQEVALWSDDLQLAGRVDCIGEYKNKLSIIDFKTSNNNKDREMVFDYFLQTTAYAIMWHERTGELIENLVILMSVEKGIVPLIFEGKIEDYIAPLLRRIAEYNA